METTKETISTTTTDIIINDSALRDKMISRLEVLDKVKKLFLISYNEMATVGQVADYYEVSANVLRQCIMKNREELENDGITVMMSRDFRELFKITLKESHRGHIVFEDENGNSTVLSSSKTMFLSKRAILRIGMLLRDSSVAQEVRTQLLNTFEEASPEQKVVAMDEESTLILKIAMSDSLEDRGIAVAAYREFKNRHAQEMQATIDTLNVENDALAYKEMEWEPRAIVEKLMRTYAAKCFHNCPYNYAASLSWKRLYDELYYEYRISLASRRAHGEQRKSPLLDYVHEEEWPILVAKAFSMCRRNNCNMEKIIGNDVVLERIERCVEEAASYEVKTQLDAVGGK